MDEDVKRCTTKEATDFFMANPRIIANRLEFDEDDEVVGEPLDYVGRFDIECFPDTFEEHGGRTAEEWRDYAEEIDAAWTPDMQGAEAMNANSYVTDVALIEGRDVYLMHVEGALKDLLVYKPLAEAVNYESAMRARARNYKAGKVAE